MSNLEKPTENSQWTYDDFVEQELPSCSKFTRSMVIHYSTENKRIKEEKRHLENKNETLNSKKNKLKSENLLLKNKLKFDVFYDLLKILFGASLGIFLSSIISGTISTNTSQINIFALIIIFMLLIRHSQKQQEKN